MDLFGIVRARPIVDGRELHAVVDRDRLHIGDGIHFNGNTEHTSRKAADQRAFHTGFEVIHCDGCLGCTLGAERENFIQHIGLKFVLVCVHKGLRSAVFKRRFHISERGVVRLPLFYHTIRIKAICFRKNFSKFTNNGYFQICIFSFEGNTMNYKSLM